MEGLGFGDVLRQGTKLNVEATVASFSPLNGEFLVLITFTKKNQKKTAQTLHNDSLPSEGISHANWVNAHAQPGVEKEPGSASEETWRAVAADLASFNTLPPPSLDPPGNPSFSLPPEAQVCSSGC